MNSKITENEMISSEAEIQAESGINGTEPKKKDKDWLNEHSNQIVLIATIVTTISTVVLAWATWSYLALTQSQLKEIKSQRELAEHQLRISYQAEIAIRTPKKLKGSDPLMAEFDIAIHGGSAKDLDIYYIFFKKDGNQITKMHVGRSYDNLVAGNTLHTVHANLEKSSSWIKDEIKSAIDKNFGLFIAVTFVQPKILPGDSLDEKCETASFAWISKLNTWDNGSEEEHKILFELLKQKQLIPKKVMGCT